jgi:hypothetical protein
MRPSDLASSFDFEARLTVYEMDIWNLFDDIPFKYLKDIFKEPEEYLDDPVRIELFTTENSRGIPVKRAIFTFKLTNPHDGEIDQFRKTLQFLVGCAEEVELCKFIRETYQEINEEEDEEEEEEEEEEDEFVLTTAKIKKICDFTAFMAFNKDITDDIKVNICNSEEKAKTMHIIFKITAKAINDEDLELWNRMEQKRKEFVFKMLEELENCKNNISDYQYLTICNKLKELY